MELHEYQTKSLLSRFGIPTPPYYVITSEMEIEERVKRSGLKEGVVKAQIHAGGRGKAGGVKIGKSADELIKHAREMLGKRFVTPQTGPEGLVSSTLILTPLVDVRHEYYISLVVDRRAAAVSVLASTEGGVEIEEVLKRDPRKLLRENVSESGRLHSFQIMRLLSGLQWKDEVAEQGRKIIDALTQLFLHFDMLTLEINPLVLTKQGTLLAVDAKATVDDNALYRQKEIAYLFDDSQLPKRELEAKRNDLAYVAMQGNIGCMVNGAGLAMATMDLIKFWGGSPANFLDVGGGASEEKVIKGFEIILSDPSVEAILVNIFGGIMSCEIIAKALIKAVSTASRSVPIVVRLEGTHVHEARTLLEKSKLPLYFAKDLDDAAKHIVKGR